jgi:hypothetical protein
VEGRESLILNVLSTNMLCLFICIFGLFHQHFVVSANMYMFC